MTSWRDKYSAGYLSNAEDTSLNDLVHVLHQTKTQYKPLPGFDSTSCAVEERLMAGVDCDEVYPGIFIGDAGAAKDREYLKRLGVTHVLNTAEGNRFGMVNTSRDYYRGTNIKYLGIHLMDLPMTNIGAHFAETAEFIDEAIRNGGKVMVHCLMGMSRSSTCVLAYLMLKRGLSAADALRTVRSSRDIRPNDGFLRQLVDLDNKLRRDRARGTAL
ncbi:dual specificity protein phosphatase 3 [Bacillus rossius redtenbacheri]|uniref:dual specificity protein phosphatase 3 n=1 Tax=Bacillus rossius redtenbacheri TaxID=93214 RepID=UPI002FDEF317